VFSFSFALKHADRGNLGTPPSQQKVELEGLDIPEMGALGYPEFVIKAETAYAE